MQVSLDNRLSAILSEVSKGDKVADIGCDHGKIANLAVEITKNKVYATDISQPSLFKALALAHELNQENMVCCLCGDGLNPIEDKDVNCIIIAGMGGMEIIKILSEAKRKYDKYILVPHSHPDRLRKYLIENNYYIKKDYIVKSDNKFYPIIVVEKQGIIKYSDFEMLFGKCDDENCRQMANKRLCEIESYIESAKGTKQENGLKEINIIKEHYENK